MHILLQEWHLRTIKMILNKYLDQLQEAGFEDKPKGWTDKSVKKYTKTFTKISLQD